MSKSKSPTKSKSLTTASDSRVEHFSKIAPREFSLSKRFNAAVGFDKEKRPAWFLFDLYAFWEFVCRIDEQLFEILPDKEYQGNPVGQLVDKLEANWPFSQEYIKEARQEYEGALKDISAGNTYSL